MRVVGATAPDWYARFGPAPPLADRPRLGGLYGGALGFALAALVPRGGPALVLHADTRDGDDLFGELALFGIEPHRRDLFPDLDDDERGLERLAVLERLRHDADRIIVASMRAADQPVPAPDALRAAGLRLAPGTRETRAWGPDALARRLAEDGWERASLVTAPGEFSVRGDIADLFPAGFSAPVRLEYFGDELEQIRTFDPQTQRATGTRDVVQFATRAHGANATAQGPEFAKLIDHFGESSPIFLVEGSAEERACLAKRPGADLDALPAGDIVYRVRQIEPVGSGPEKLRERVAETGSEAKEVFFACRNDAEEKRVRELLGDTVPESLRYVRGRLTRSFVLPARDIAVLGYDDLLQHLTRRQPARRRTPTRPLDDFLDLESGDYVAHLAHGIGIFRGVETIEKDGAPVEHCAVEFADGVRVFVPVTKIDLIQKYVGAPRGRPRLAKLGGTAWGKAKERAKKAVSDLAVRMLEVQAMREKSPGLAHPADDDLQHGFEASFPYEETPDQLTAIDAIKEDMERPRPMDRLLCGDVGYGKTELAMRAAFKAVIGNRQAAVLVPTTVLAAQHFTTFCERMAGYAVRIEMLSRFRTAKEARAIMEGLEDGTIDIVIGTHRLLSPAMRFANLGLVVIDEEQRFGVEHKERLKSLRATVDVLTLTATPIPRTLNLALLGLRDISNLTTPPEGRMPIDTVVHAYDEKLILTYLLRELRRGGQVYFVHNRVQTIYRIVRLVQGLVPEAQVALAHGQQPRKALEDAMLRFVRGDADILVATTIIESGLDIPNANTLIVDRADRIGLADLHQLRGRVGRGRHKAHALFLLPPERRLVREIAEKRMRTIEEHSGLGAGFRIALKDLEIRGAGNILGAEQSGYIADIGYELYCRLLESAVRELRNEKVTAPTDTYVDLNVDARFPDRYVGDRALKLGFYRRVSAARDGETLAALREEIEDRCGLLPESARCLFAVARLRIIGQDHGIARFALATGGTLQMTMTNPDKALPFLRQKLGRMLRLPEGPLAIYAEPVRPPRPAAALARYLELLDDSP